MKNSIFAIAFVVFVSGCQTASTLTGSGPITLSDRVAQHFNEKYLLEIGPGFYVVSEDGRTAQYTYCSAGPGGCSLGTIEFEGISRCEKRSGKKCYIFAEGRNVVWKGPVRFGSAGSAMTSTEAWKTPFAPPKNNFHLCNQAVSQKYAQPTWSKSTDYVNEAKSRELTPKKCMEIISIGSGPVTSNSGGLSDLSAAALCVSAIKNGAWNTSSRVQAHVAEAKKRGLTPEKCG